MGRGNWRPSRDWPAYDLLHFDIPMLAFEDHLKEHGEEGWRTHQGELEETTRDYFEHFMAQIPTILPPSFYPDDKWRQGEHVLYSNSLCYVIFDEEDTYYAVAVVARDDLNEYGDTLESLAKRYVEAHARSILDKLARLYPGSATYPSGPWTSSRYTPPLEETPDERRNRRRRRREERKSAPGAV